MTKNKLKELSYYLFFTIMILAKGIGLDSGDKLYYVLSGVACLCVGVKLILTKYNVRQIAAMILLGFIAFVAYRNSGRMGILLSVLTIIGLKDMDVKKLFKLGSVVYGAAFGFTVVAAKLGLIDNPLAVHEKGGMEMIRWGMGYSTGNVFHVSYFIMVVLLCYSWGKRYNWKKLLWLMAGNGLVFLYSLSYTGAAVTVFYLLLNLYAVKRKRLSVAEKVICQLPLPLCLLFSFGAPMLLEHPMVQRLDQLLQARLTFSAYYLQNQPKTLFGTRMTDVPNFWVIMDNGYVYFFMTFGAVAFVLLCAGYAVLIARYSGVRIRRCGGVKCKDGTEPVGNTESSGQLVESEASGQRLTELVMIFSFLLYGIMEQFISNAFMNLSLLFLGDVLFGWDEGACGKLENGCGTRKTVKRYTKYMCVIGLAAGLVTAVIYSVRVPMREYIAVPLTSLNSVNAQRLLVHVENEEGTKDALKQKMQEYEQYLKQEEMIQGALESTGLEEKLTVDEVAAAFETGLPMEVHSGKVYDTFRVRLLELYHDVSEEEYAALLGALIQGVQAKTEIGDGSGADLYVEDPICREQIGKSFGIDRIEHMSSKQYMVEKSGTVVQMEYVRDVVFVALLGGLIGYGLAVMVYRKDSFYQRMAGK